MREEKEEESLLESAFSVRELKSVESSRLILTHPDLTTINR
jgi:hypothetical protein